MPRIKYFKDDHGRTLRVSVDASGAIQLALISEAREAIYFPAHTNPIRGNGIENCSAFSQLEEAAKTCPLRV